MILFLQVVFTTFVGTVCVLGFSKWLVEILELDKVAEPEPFVMPPRLVPKGTKELIKIHRICINRFILGTKTPTQKIIGKRLQGKGLKIRGWQGGGRRPVLNSSPCTRFHF